MDNSIEFWKGEKYILREIKTLVCQACQVMSANDFIGFQYAKSLWKKVTCSEVSKMMVYGAAICC